MATLLSLNPFAELRRSADLMDQMLESSMGQWPAGNFGSAYTVPMDIWEENGKLMIKAAVPGIKPEDLDVTLQDNLLTISGEMQNQHEDTNAENRRVYMREFRYGSFTRSIRLPEDIDENNVDAQFDNGFVMIQIPRRQPQIQQPKKLQVRNVGQMGPQTQPIEGRHEIPAENQPMQKEKHEPLRKEPVTNR